MMIDFECELRVYPNGKTVLLHSLIGGTFEADRHGVVTGIRLDTWDDNKRSFTGPPHWLDEASEFFKLCQRTLEDVYGDEIKDQIAEQFWDRAATHADHQRDQIVQSF